MEVPLEFKVGDKIRCICGGDQCPKGEIVGIFNIHYSVNDNYHLMLNGKANILKEHAILITPLEELL